ncbi:MAG: hypothetical protein KA066_02945 [Candidatus Pacebacteria bacterium]|nr:hypothetical protein [Candidatus Paceibacterota bacterium]
MTKMVTMIHARNNGIVALVTEEHYEILKTCSIYDAQDKGVRWFVFASKHRVLGNPVLAGYITATYEEILSAPEFHMVDKNIYVPLSNGPRYYEVEAKFVAPFSEFLKHFALHAEFAA